MGTILSTERSAKIQELLFEHAIEGIVVTDGSGRIMMASPRFRDLFGLGSADLSLVHIEDRIPKA